MAHNEYLLKPDETLKQGQWLRSRNGLFHASMQDDGNFCIYRGDWSRYNGPFNTSLWSRVMNTPKKGTGKPPYQITMQRDGNLVIYGDGDSHKAYWAIWDLVPEKKQSDMWAVLNDDGEFGVAPGGDWSRRWWATDTRDTIDENSIQWDTVDYQLAEAKLTSLGRPNMSVSDIATNDTSVTQKHNLEMTYTKTASTSFKTTTTLKIGAKSSTKAGLPTVVEETVEISGELSESIEWNKVNTDTQAIKITLAVEVPPHKKIIGRCISHLSTISVPFKLVGTATFKGFSYGRIPVSVEGVFDGTQTHDVETSWSEIQKDQPNLRFWTGTEKVS